MKKILISPYTKTTTTFAKSLKNVEILGYIDKVQEGENIFKIENLNQDFDFIYILSPNHFESIYKDLKAYKSKILKVEIKNGEYIFLSREQIFRQKIKNFSLFLKQRFFKYFALFLDKINYKRKKCVFLTKNFVGGNNKFLYFALHEAGKNPVLLSLNEEQIAILEQKNFSVYHLHSFNAFFQLAFAKWLIVNQGDCGEILLLKSPKQKLMQLWHGIPLEKMNLLTEVTYDAFISTSPFVTEEGFKKVFLAKEFLNLGYPRNDSLLKKTHSQNDLMFTDERLYNICKNTDKKVITYMPTWRESLQAQKKAQIDFIGIDFKRLEEFLKQQNAIFIFKLHPFLSDKIQDFFKDFDHIFLHETKGNIYPLLKYTDILISDYSSVYYDFLLLDRPIIFYLYDHGTCSKMSHGYLFEFDDFSPGGRAYNQNELEEKLLKALSGEDDFKSQREELKNKLFSFQDDKSCQRIMEVLEK